MQKYFSAFLAAIFCITSFEYAYAQQKRQKGERPAKAARSGGTSRGAGGGGNKPAAARSGGTSRGGGGGSAAKSARSGGTSRGSARSGGTGRGGANARRSGSMGRGADAANSKANFLVEEIVANPCPLGRPLQKLVNQMGESEYRATQGSTCNLPVNSAERRFSKESDPVLPGWIDPVEATVAQCADGYVAGKDGDLDICVNTEVFCPIGEVLARVTPAEPINAETAVPMSAGAARAQSRSGSRAARSGGTSRSARSGGTSRGGAKAARSGGTSRGGPAKSARSGGTGRGGPAGSRSARSGGTGRTRAAPPTPKAPENPAAPEVTLKNPRTDMICIMPKQTALRPIAGTSVASMIGCPANTYSAPIPGAGGFHLQCVSCPRGKVSLRDSFSPEDCYTLCPENQTNNPVNPDMCVQCSDNSKYDGTTRFCVCDVGYYGDGAGPGACRPCEVGSFCPGGGEILECDYTAGEYTAAKGAKECRLCPPNSVSEGGKTCSCVQFGKKFNSETGKCE